VLPVLPMLVPEVVGVDGSKEDAWNDDVDGKTSPEITGGSSVLLNSQPLPVESVVGRSGKLGWFVAREAALKEHHAGTGGR